jgi:transposase
MSYVKPADRKQFTIMGCLDDLIASDHPIRLLDELVERVVAENPSVFGAEPVGDVGRPEFSPVTMLKVFTYGTLNSIRASRKLEVEAKRNIEMIWLLGSLAPDHWTIAKYRRTHGDQITLFGRTLRQFLHTQGYIEAERIAIDGSKFKANASQDMLSAESLTRRLAFADKELEKYLAMLEANDRRDDVLDEQDEEGSNPNENELLDTIARLQERIEKLSGQRQQLEDSGKTYFSPTDPEASLVKGRGGKHPGYNVQFAVDSKHGFIVADTVVADTSDICALPVMVDAVEEELRQPASGIYIADRGYYNLDLTEQVERKHPSLRCYVAVRRSRNHYPNSPITFTYDQEHDCFWCSEGKPLPINARNVRTHNGVFNRYRGTDCQGCHKRTQCTTSSVCRQVNRFFNQEWRERYVLRMQSPIARMMLRIRKCLAEHPFGTIKSWAGKIPLLLRGRAKIKTEIKLLVTGFNLKRLFNLARFDILLNQINSHTWASA